MKKVFSLLFVAVALVAVSCGGNANKPAEQVEEVDVVAIVEDTVANDACACADSTCCAEGEACKGTAEACATAK